MPLSEAQVAVSLVNYIADENSPFSQFDIVLG